MKKNDTTQLKAQAYDLLVQIQNLQAQLAEVNRAIVQTETDSKQ